MTYERERKRSIGSDDPERIEIGGVGIEKKEKRSRKWR